MWFTRDSSFVAQHSSFAPRGWHKHSFRLPTEVCRPKTHAVLQVSLATVLIWTSLKTTPPTVMFTIGQNLNSKCMTFHTHTLHAILPVGHSLLSYYVLLCICNVGAACRSCFCDIVDTFLNNVNCLLTESCKRDPVYSFSAWYVDLPLENSVSIVLEGKSFTYIHEHISV